MEEDGKRACTEDQGSEQSYKAMQQGGERQEGEQNQGFQEAREKPHSNICHQISLSVDPDVMEYVSNSSYCAELKKLTGEWEVTLNWQRGENSADLEYRGEINKAWRKRCLDDVHSFLNKFEKCEIPFQREIWDDLQHQMKDISNSLGRDPPLLKSIEGQFKLIMVASRCDTELYKERLQAKIANMYKKLTFQKKKIPNISKIYMHLLEVMNFDVEHLRGKCPDVKVVFDSDKREICLEGPSDEINIAEQEIRNHEKVTTKTQMTLGQDEFKILDTKAGKEAIHQALRRSNVDAVVEFNPSQKSIDVLGSSHTHTSKAAEVITNVVVKQSVLVEEKCLPLIETPEWLNYCEKVKSKTGVLLCKQDSGDICILGLEHNVTKAVNKLQHYLDNNAEWEEEIECSSSDIKEYLLRCIKPQLEENGVKVRDGDDNLIYISGREDMLAQALQLLEERSGDVVVSNLDFDQPGLRRFCESSDLDVSIRKIEEQEKCFIRIEKNLPSGRSTTGSTGVDFRSRSAGVSSSGSSAIVTANGHNVSWKPGDITKEQVRTDFELYSMFVLFIDN